MRAGSCRRIRCILGEGRSGSAYGVNLQYPLTRFQEANEASDTEEGESANEGRRLKLKGTAESKGTAYRARYDQGQKIAPLGVLDVIKIRFDFIGA